jgi:cobalt transporter subunit CbtA
MMIRVLLAALVAGVLAGGFATAAQQVRVVPLILAAETYETGEASHGHDEAAATVAQSQDAAEPWAPADGIERTLFTAGANLLVGVAFSLILTAGILLSRQAVGLSSGIAWGAAGFVAFVLAPNFGLPPELPGMAAADLPARQGWWAATVVLTAAGLWIFAFRRGIGWMALGVALVLAMHIVGAPQPAAHETGVPANLAAEFAVATIVTSAAFWVVLGGLLGYALNRAMSAEAATG